MIKSSILTLYKSLIKENLRKEAYSLAMLYLTAGYDDDWRHIIDGLARSNKYPFSSWFTEYKDREVIKFTKGEDPDDYPDEVVDAFFLINMKIDNYSEGYAIDSSNRRVKIGRALNKAISKHQSQLKHLEVDSNEYSSLSEEIEMFKNGMNIFNNDPNRSRSKENEYHIIISQDPHDVARASHERRWGSCLNIGSGPGDGDAGSNAQTIFCEVQDGGMIAYLTGVDDDEIDEPYARILIRRFMNKNGHNIAIAEDEVYGDTVPGFKETVTIG